MTNEDQDVCKLAAYKLKAEEKLIKQMLEDNEHNKYTTLYYLLVKKKDRGDLELEKELEEYAEKEMKKEQDKIKKSKKGKLAPPPLEDLNEPDMFISRNRIEESQQLAPRTQSRSLGISLDPEQISQPPVFNKIQLGIGKELKSSNEPTITKPKQKEDKEKASKRTSVHGRKKSASKSKGKRALSKDLDLKLYLMLMKIRRPCKRYS